MSLFLELGESVGNVGGTLPAHARQATLLER
jgi:hypothetical protein